MYLEKNGHIYGTDKNYYQPNSDASEISRTSQIATSCGSDKKVKSYFHVFGINSNVLYVVMPIGLFHSSHFDMK